MRIGFIGAGRVGTGLARVLTTHGYAVVAVASRHRASAEALAVQVPGCMVHEAAQAVADTCDLVFVTTPDDAIAPVAASVRWREGMAVVHCSGAAEVETLAPARAAGAQVGGFHPLQIFEDAEAAARNLRGAIIAVEAGEPLAGELGAIAEAIGGRPIALPPGARVIYHASASFASPFVAALLQEAARLWERIGLSADDALAALVPLARGTLDIVERAGTARATGGPAARGDLGTIRRHLAALARTDGEAALMYRRMLLTSLPLAQTRGSLSEAGAAELAGMLREETVDDRR